MSGVPDSLPIAELGRRRRRTLRSWARRLSVELRYGRRLLWRRFLDATPVGHLRLVLLALLLLSGTFLLSVLVVPQYDRALVLSGRTEVLSMKLDDAAFGMFSFARSVWRADPDSAAQEGDLEIEILPGTTVRFVRTGRGDVRLTFAAGPAATTDSRCGSGLRQVGSASFAAVNRPLCETALVVVRLRPGDEPLVVALSGGIVVGEEVSQGAGTRPLLLDATASLLVKHGNWFFRRVCSFDTLENLCDRFVANSVALSPGDSVRADDHLHSQSSPGLGFIRIDPNEISSGMLFNLAAPATAFQVQRMQGETFTVRESLFDVIEKSPVVRTLNTVVVALGLIWYFVRLTSKDAGRSGDGGKLAAALILASLYTPNMAYAQQALIRAEDTGQALLRSRGERCYAVTPSHVLGAETSVLATAPGRERGEGDLLSRIPSAPEAIALIALRGIPLSVCPVFEGAVSLDTLLRSHSEATLRLVRADGSIDQLPLLVGSVEVETLEVRSAAGSLAQGMSGGTVLIANQPAGLLFDVTDEGHTGRVGRWDRISERLLPHLTNAIPAEAARAPAGSVAYEILRSNAAPIAPENKVSSLQGDGPGPWRVTAEGRIDLIIKVSAPFSGIVLDLTALPDPPQTLEMLGSRSASGPWQSLANLALEPGDTIQQRRFPPVALSYVLIRAYVSTARKTVAIARLSLIPK